MDYLDESGNLLAATGVTPPSGWFYKRVWKIDDHSSDATLATNLKRITVAAATSRGFGGATRAASYLAVLKTAPF